MFVLITCMDYSVIRELKDPYFDPSILPALCRIEEDNRNDGYAVLATHYGRIIANSSGMIEPDEEYCPDHATLTGMYDRDF